MQADLLPVAGTSAEGMTQIARSVNDSSPATPSTGSEFLIQSLSFLSTIAVGLIIAWFTSWLTLRSETKRRQEDLAAETKRRQDDQRQKTVAELRSAYAAVAAAMNNYATAIGIYGHAIDVLAHFQQDPFVAAVATDVAEGAKDREQFLVGERAHWEREGIAASQKLAACLFALAILERDQRRLNAVEEYSQRLHSMQTLYSLKRSIGRQTKYTFLLGPAYRGFDVLVKHIAIELEAMESGKNPIQLVSIPDPTYDFPQGWVAAGLHFCHVDDNGKAKNPPSAAR